MSVLFLFNGDLDFSREMRVQLLHVVHFAFIAALCFCLCVFEHMKACAHGCQRQDLWVLQLSPSYFQRRWQVSCLSKSAANYCLVFLLVQKCFKNTNDCIFMVVTLHPGLLCVLEKWFLWQSSSSQLAGRQTGRPGLWFSSGTSCF